MNFMRLGLGIATIAVGLSSCAAPANDAGNETSHTFTSGGSPTSSNSASNEQGWSLPEPGSFDHATSSNQFFKPCKDIPDEVFAQLGWTKANPAGDLYSPYACDFRVDGQREGESYSLSSWDISVEEGINLGLYEVSEADGVGLGVTIARNTGSFSNESCEALYETPRGLISLMYLRFSNTDLKGRECEVVAVQAKKFFGGEYQIING